jgi:hypothetical protein
MRTQRQEDQKREEGHWRQGSPEDTTAPRSWSLIPRRILSEMQVMVPADVGHDPVYPKETLEMTL